MKKVLKYQNVYESIKSSYLKTISINKKILSQKNIRANSHHVYESIKMYIEVSNQSIKQYTLEFFA
jgi:hypothetical protein